MSDGSGPPAKGPYDPDRIRERVEAAIRPSGSAEMSEPQKALTLRGRVVHVHKGEWCAACVLHGEEQAATEARRELLAKVEVEQPCTCNPAYGRILGADGAHALECVGRTSLRNGIRRLIEEPDHAV